MSYLDATPPAEDRQRWYPGMPPVLPGETDETDEQYINRCHEWKRNADQHVQRWNAANPPGTVVVFPESANEPPVPTVSRAWVTSVNGIPVVDLHTFPDPVHLAWITPDGTR